MHMQHGTNEPHVVYNQMAYWKDLALGRNISFWYVCSVVILTAGIWHNFLLCMYVVR